MMNPDYAVGKYDGVLQNSSAMRMELEDTLNDGLNTFVKDVTGMSLKEAAADMKTLAGLTTHALVYTALMQEGEDGLAAEYKAAIGGDGDYSEVVAKVKDTQILQTKYGIQNIYDVQKQFEALAGAGKLTAKNAQNQIEQYAGQRVFADAQTALGLLAETPDGVAAGNAYLGDFSGNLGVAYFDASSPQELAQKGVSAIQLKSQIDQTLENRVI